MALPLSSNSPVRLRCIGQNVRERVEHTAIVVFSQLHGAK